MNPQIIYVDIDDTLIRSFGSKRIPMTEMVRLVRDLKKSGAALVQSIHCSRRRRLRSRYSESSSTSRSRCAHLRWSSSGDQ